MNHDKWLRNDQERRGFNNSEHEQFQEAESRVLFEGFEVQRFKRFKKVIFDGNIIGIIIEGKADFYHYKTLEDLTHLNLELTDNALKG